MKIGGIIQMEHEFGRKFGRIKNCDVGEIDRVISRRMRRRWARRFGMRRVPVVIPTEALTEMIRDIRAELDRRLIERHA